MNYFITTRLITTRRITTKCSMNFYIFFGIKRIMKRIMMSRSNIIYWVSYRIIFFSYRIIRIIRTFILFIFLFISLYCFK